MGDKFRNTIAPTQNNSSASIEGRESSSFNVNLVQFVLESSRAHVQLSNFLPCPQATMVLQPLPAIPSRSINRKELSVQS